MTMKDKKRKEYEAEVLRRKQGIEDARNERELREYQDQMQNSFVKNFESGELVHQFKRDQWEIGNVLCEMLALSY